MKFGNNNNIGVGAVLFLIAAVAVPANAQQQGQTAQIPSCSQRAEYDQGTCKTSPVPGKCSARIQRQLQECMATGVYPTPYGQSLQSKRE